MNKIISSCLLSLVSCLLFTFVFAQYNSLPYYYPQEYYPPAGGSRTGVRYTRPSPGSGGTGVRFTQPAGGGRTVLISNPLSGVANDIPSLIGFILRTARWIAGSIAVLMIIFGAYQIMFAAGNLALYEKGKMTIVYAVVGLTIILMSDIIVSILREITRF